MSQLNHDVVELLNDNTKPMVANFTKIVSWLKNGQESEHKMPPKVLAFLEAHDKAVETSKETALKVDTIAGIADALNNQLAQATDNLNKVTAQLNDATASLQSALQRLETVEAKYNDLETKYNTLASEQVEAKPKGRAKKQAVSEPANTVQEQAKPTEPKTTEPVQAQQTAPADEVELTAKAVGAGEVSSAGLSEIASLIDNAIGGVTLQPSQKKATVMDEL